MNTSTSPFHDGGAEGRARVRASERGQAGARVAAHGAGGAVEPVEMALADTPQEAKMVRTLLLEQATLRCEVRALTVHAAACVRQLFEPREDDCHPHPHTCPLVILQPIPPGVLTICVPTLSRVLCSQAAEAKAEVHILRGEVDSLEQALFEARETIEWLSGGAGEGHGGARSAQQQAPWR